jgi:hypothetical protein
VCELVHAFLTVKLLSLTRFADEETDRWGNLLSSEDRIQVALCLFFLEILFIIFIMCRLITTQ